MTFEELIRKSTEEGAHDALKLKEHDPDLCMLCAAYGADKRSLILDCGYDVKEAVPEMLRLDQADDERFRNRGFYLRICKSCRSAFLKHLQIWCKEQNKRRGLPKDDDGNLEETDRDIPVRVMGAVFMMTEEEYWNYRKEQNNGREDQESES